MHTDHSGALPDEDEDYSLYDLVPEWFNTPVPVTPSTEESYFSTVIKPRIMAFLQDKGDYAYHKNGFQAAQYNADGTLLKSGHIDCSHLMYEVSGKVGSITSKYRYSECKKLGIEHGALFDAKGNLKVELVEGMEVYKESNEVPNGHVGMLLLYDFGTGRGLEWAVFQSASVAVTMVDALFESDTGPNITAFYGPNGKSKWKNYTAPHFLE